MRTILIAHPDVDVIAGEQMRVTDIAAAHAHGDHRRILGDVIGQFDRDDLYLNGGGTGVLKILDRAQDLQRLNRRLADGAKAGPSRPVRHEADMARHRDAFPRHGLDEPGRVRAIDRIRAALQDREPFADRFIRRRDTAMQHSGRDQYRWRGFAHRHKGVIRIARQDDDASLDSRS